MIYNQTKPGLNNVAEYMASGLPYLTSSVATSAEANQVDFPCVTNYIEVANHTTGSNLLMGFSENGVNGTNYASIEPNTIRLFKVRARTIFLKSDGTDIDFDVVAGLTGIDTQFVLTSSKGPDDRAWVNEFVYPGVG